MQNEHAKHIVIPKNKVGRDFVIGDIHAHKKKFLRALASVNFDESKDRLFAIGDLIDRGRQPLFILNLLYEKDWFFSIIGNHEQQIFNRFEFPITKPMYTSSVKTQLDAVKLHNFNGGKWFSKLRESAQNNIYELLKQQPYAMTLETEQGNIGLVHAEVPDSLESWTEMLGRLEKDDKKIIEDMIWGRDAIAEFYDYHRHRKWGNEAPVADRWIQDIELTVHGHTGVIEPQVHGNQLWIDTGQVTGNLTILEVNELFELMSKENEIF